MKKLFSILILSVIAVFAFVSCNLGESDGLSMYVTGDPNYTSTKSVSTRSTNDFEGITTTIGSDTIVVTKVEMVILELKLDVHSDNPDEPDEVEDLEVGPFLFKLPLDGSVANLFNGIPVPAAIYDELEIEVDAPGGDDEHEAFFAENYPEWNDEHEVSIRVTGTFNDGSGPVDFVYKQYGFNEDFAIEFEPPLEINGGGTSIVLAIDVSNWFTYTNDDGDKKLFNPGETVSTVENYPKPSQIEDNIEDSFEAFEDSLED